MGHERDVQIRLESDSLSGDELDIHRVLGIDHISQLFTYTIEADRVAAVDEDALMLKPVSLVFTTAEGEEVQRVFGLVSRIRDVAEPHVERPRFEITLVPRAFAATMREMLDIFMEMSIPEIIEACLTRCGLASGEHFDLGGLTDTYAKKEYVVQYRETDFAFVSRLCEHHGIWFIVDHSTGKDVLTFGDRNAAFPESERTPELPFAPVETVAGSFYEHVGTVDITRQPLPKRYTVRDYNYRMPGVDLMSSVDVDPDGLGEIVEYGPHFKNPDEGKWFASIRAQELKAHARIWTLLANAPAICAGQKFMLTAHPNGDSELLVTAVRHAFHNRGDGDAGTGMSTTVTAIDASTAYRPPRLTAKPHVHGIITGMIDAGLKDGYADVDDQGRYRVRFMFDTAARGEGQASRLVRMAQPHAGEGYGMHFPLRPGTEVILSCIDGDPDRPIITGTVPNPSTVSPVSSANRDRNMIRTGGGNEIDISDEDGAHRIKMSTPHAGTVFQLGAPNAAEMGAIISTSANMTSQVAGTVGAMSDVASAINDFRGNVTGKNVVTTAGIPNPIKGWEAVEKLASSGAKAAASLADTIDSVANFGKKLKDNETGRLKKAEDAILKAADREYPNKALTKEVDDPNGGKFTVTETEKQYRDRLLPGAVEKADPHLRSEYELAKGSYARTLGLGGLLIDHAVDGSMATAYEDSELKTKVDALKTTAGAVSAAVAVKEAIEKSKNIKALFSKQHENIQKAMEAAVKAGAIAAAGNANLAAGLALPRKQKTVRLPSTHYNLITASDSAIAHGLQGFYGLSPVGSFVYGGTTAMIVSDKSLCLYGGTQAELASKFVQITSNLLDIESRKQIKIKSGHDTKIDVGKELHVTSQEDTKHESKKKFFLKTKDLLDVDGGDEVKMKGKKWTIDSTEADYKLNVAGMLKVDAKKMIQLKHKSLKLLQVDGLGIFQHEDGGKLRVGGATANLEVKGGTSVALTKSGMTVEGKTQLDVNATTINIKGKVLLG